MKFTGTKSIIIFNIIFILLASCGDKKTNNNENGENPLKEPSIPPVTKTLDSVKVLTLDDYLLTPDDYLRGDLIASSKITQNNIAIPQNRVTKARLHKVYEEPSINKFDLATDEIHVVLPTTSPNLKITSVKDISSNSQNAIQINVQGNNGIPTNEETITRLIDATFKISDLNMDTLKLRRDKQLKVFVLHDETPSDIVLMDLCIINCVDNSRSYNEDNCNCGTRVTEQILKVKDWTEDMMRPKEVDGSILKGG